MVTGGASDANGDMIGLAALVLKVFSIQPIVFTGSTLPLIVFSRGEVIRLYVLICDAFLVRKKLFSSCIRYVTISFFLPPRKLYYTRSPSGKLGWWFLVSSVDEIVILLPG